MTTAATIKPFAQRTFRFVCPHCGCRGAKEPHRKGCPTFGTYQAWNRHGVAVVLPVEVVRSAMVKEEMS